MGKWFRKVMVFGVSISLITAIVIAGNHYYETIKPAAKVSFIMDTVIEQKLYGKRSQEAVEEIEKRLQNFEKKFSMYLPDSEISQVNQNAGKSAVTLSPEVFELLKRSVQLCEETKGTFDITIGPLTNLWKVTSDHPQIPDQQELDSARALVDYRDVIFEEDQVMLRREGQSIDLGAVAKGYACDIVREVFEEYELKTGYVSIGGNMVVLGDDVNGQPYVFGIRDPLQDASHYLGTVTLKGKTMATTGGYERYFEVDGKRYHHVIDPRTGYPVKSDFLSVSVISEDGTLADFLSTAFFIAGKESVWKYMDEADFQIVAVDIGGNVYYSEALKGNFTPNPETLYSFFLNGGNGHES